MRLSLARLYHLLNGSLRARLVVPIATLAVGSLSLMAATAIQLHVGDVLRASQDRAALFSSLATNAVAAHMENYEHTDVSPLLGALLQHRPDLDKLSIINADGVVTATTESERRGTSPWTRAELDTDAPLHPSDSGFALIRALPKDARCSACHDTSRPIGFVELHFNDAWVLASQRRLTTSLTLAAVPAFLLMIGVAWWLLGREAIKPIQRLLAAMKLAAEGKNEVRADEGRPDEIGLATRRFDATFAALQRTQRELHAMYEERMVRADRFAMVGQMATGLAHEIKNPLAGLSGALELLAEDMAESPHGHVVEEMQHQVKRLTSIMEGLLNFARPPVARLEATDVNRPLEKALFLLSGQRGRQPVTIERALGQELPTVHADAGQLEQVFLNIGLNALQVLQATGGTLTVRSYASDARVIVEFHDTGPGIAPEVRPHIFTPFFTTRSNGTGLGLALSMRLVTEHGGKLEFDCPGVGTTFTISLPAAVDGAARRETSVL